MPSKPSVIWMTNSLGYSGNLMYWEPILFQYAKYFPGTEIYTSEPIQDVKIPGLNFFSSIPRIQIGRGRFKINIPSAIAVLGILRKKPRVIVTSEFGPLSLISSFYCRYSKDSRLLLLIEGDPSFLKFNGVNRTSRITQLVRKYIANGAYRALCNNKSAENYAINSLNIKRERLIAGCYLTSTFEKTTTHTDEIGIEDKLVRFLFVGQVSLAKGVHHLLNAISKIRSEFEGNASLTIVGTGPDYEHILRQSLDLKLQGIVTFVGRIPYRELGALYHNADILINPSLGDYRALVGFEAISSGLAIIGSVFDGASTEVIAEGENGFIIDPKNEKLMAARILSFLQDQSLLHRFKLQSLSRSKMYRVEMAVENLKYATHVCMT